MGVPIFDPTLDRNILVDENTMLSDCWLEFLATHPDRPETSTQESDTDPATA